MIVSFLQKPGMEGELKSSGNKKHRGFRRLFAHQGNTNAVIQVFIFIIPVQYAHVGIWVSRALSPTHTLKTGDGGVSSTCRHGNLERNMVTSSKQPFQHIVLIVS